MDAFLNASNCMVFVTGLSFYVTATPPNRRVDQSELIINTWAERFFLPRLMFLNLFVGSACFMHVFSSVSSLGMCTLRTFHGTSESFASPSITTMVGGVLTLCQRIYAYGMVLRRDGRSPRLRSEHQEGPSTCNHRALLIRSTSWLHRLLRSTHRRVDGDVLEGSLALSVWFNEHGWRDAQLYLVRGGSFN